MSLNQPLLAIGVLLSASTFNAQASLTSYTANGVDFVRMQGAGFDVSFTKNGNLFQTLAASNADLIRLIAAVTPTYNDPAYGLQTIDTDDFNTTTGRMTWWGGKAFVNYLNNVNYGGSNQWSLPGWTDTGQAGEQLGYKDTDSGYNVDPSSSPLAQLYYGELNKKSNFITGGIFQSGYGIFSSNGAQIDGGAVGPFTNVQSDAYWFGTEYAPDPNYAWFFYTATGAQIYTRKDINFYAWTYVNSVPVPGTVWFFGTGLVGWLAARVAPIRDSVIGGMLTSKCAITQANRTYILNESQLIYFFFPGRFSSPDNSAISPLVKTVLSFFRTEPLKTK